LVNITTSAISIIQLDNFTAGLLKCCMSANNLLSLNVNNDIHI
jgi:hypothetical protein